jgi:hypothetical protein
MPLFEYEKTTFTSTRVRISLGSIIGLIVVVFVIANRKTAVSDATTLVEYVAITVGTACLIGLAALIISLRRTARARRNVTPKTIRLYPSYELNSEPVAQIENRRVIIDGEEYVKVIHPDKIAINSQYGKGRPSA